MADVISFGRSNICEFKFNEKKVVLKLVKPKSAVENKAELSLSMKTRSLFIL